VDLSTDFFSLFHLPRAFRIDLAELDARYLEIQARVHPDRFAHAGEGERRLSMQWATRANEGYQTLKNPWSGPNTCCIWPATICKPKAIPPWLPSS